MELFVGLLWFIAFSAIMIFGIWRMEVNTRVIDENTETLVRLEKLFAAQSVGDREAILPKPHSEIVTASSAPQLQDAEIVRIPRPKYDTLLEGSEPPPPRDTTPDEPSADASLDDEDEFRPTTVLPRCGKCGSVNFTPTSGLFKCNHCGKIGHLTFPGLEDRKVA